MASLDCVVLRGVLSFDATWKIHDMRLLIKTSRLVILVFKAVLRSLRGMELPKQCSIILDATLHLALLIRPLTI